MWLGVDLKMDTEKDTSLNEIGWTVQNMFTIPRLIVNMIKGDSYDHTMSTKILTLISNKMFTWAP